MEPWLHLFLPLNCVGRSVADAVVVFRYARAEAELIQTGIRANPVTAAAADVIAAAVAGL